jgi:uncharacterized protein YjbJ (UPF0337 family)
MSPTKNEWKETKTKIKARFGKLSNSDIEELNGHMEKLSSKVQRTYDWEKIRAEQECKAFSQSLKNTKDLF